MSTTIVVRDVPDEVREELVALADRAGRSLQEHLRLEFIAMARRPSGEALLERVRARLDATGSRLDAETILAHRDAHRR